MQDFTCCAYGHLLPTFGQNEGDPNSEPELCPLPKHTTTTSPRSAITWITEGIEVFVL